MKTYILYHAGCMDGLASAWVARNAFRDAGAKEGDMVFLPVHHQEPAPEIEGGSDVYILDFCYPFEQLKKYWESARRLTIIDHHKTAKEPIQQMNDLWDRSLQEKGAMPVRPTVLFNESKSGCRLTYEYFYGHTYDAKDVSCAPGIIRYIEDRDLWAWKLFGSREINACIRSYPIEFNTLYRFNWLRVLEEAPSYGNMGLEGILYMEGVGILRYQQSIIDTHVSFSQEVEIAGYKVLAVNATTLTSEIGEKLAQGRPFGAVWFDTKNGKRVWSLRSTKDGIDVSEVAKKYGGGGHKHAAGFTTVSNVFTVDSLLGIKEIAR